MQPPAAPRARSGFTLVELVVVLTILAVLAATATVSTAGIVDQSRYDATRTTLTDVESAVLGRPGQLDSQNHPWVQGFVADVGRLPVVMGTPGIDEETDATLLSELWFRQPDPNDPDDPLDPSIIKSFSIQHAPGDEDVQLPCGWRGPYVRLPLGSAKLLDGWGEPLRLVAADGSPAAAAQSVAGFATLGANALAGGAGYDADFGVVLASTVAPLVQPRNEGDVPFQVTGSVPTTAAGDVYVIARLYGPLNGSLETYDQPFLADDSGTPDDLSDDTPIALQPGDDIDFSGRFEHVPIGPRALRVYLINIDPTTIDEETALLDSEIVKKSAIVYLTVVAGGLSTVPLNFTE